MSKFYFLLWLRWAARVVTCSVLLAYFFSLLITAYSYLSSSQPSIDVQVFNALRDVLEFWFPIVWSLTLLLALFRSLKYIFNVCINGYKFQLLTCKGDEVIEIIGYGDLVKVWRRWFMLNIWLVGAFMIVAVILTSLFSSYSGVFEWFDIYWLSAFILVSGYFSFILLGARCRKVKVSKC